MGNSELCHDRARTSSPTQLSSYLIGVTLWRFCPARAKRFPEFKPGHPSQTRHSVPAEHDDVAKMPVTDDDGFEALLEPFYNGKKLTDPIATKEDKYQLLPAFLKVKGMSAASRACFRSLPILLIAVSRSCQTAYRLVQLFYRP